MSENKDNTKTSNPAGEESADMGINAPADFERAIDTVGYGMFNIFLLLAALPAAMATVFETSVVSYILPSAECDLKLTLIDKGVLNAVTYAGMITSAIIWGYLADTKGRKKTLVFGYLADVICVLGGALSQNVVQLMIFKFMGGVLMCGPFAILMSYMTELHNKKFRARVMMIIGMMFTTATLTLPLLALSILPQKWDFEMIGLKFHSWQVFLAVSAIPSLLSGLAFCLFPESPKFLMSQNRNTEALQVFRLMYALNKHTSKDAYPIKELKLEKPQKSDEPDSIATIEIAKVDVSNLEPTGEPQKQKHPTVGLREGLQQLRPLFVKPYLLLSLQVYLMNFAVLLSQHTIRLWLPQLFASIKEFEQTQGNAGTSMCAILEYSVNKTNTVVNSDETAAHNCEVVITAESYTNNIIVAAAGFGGFILGGLVINRIGSKHLITIASLTAGTCSILLYFSGSELMTLIIASIFVTMGGIAAQSLLSSSVNLFPTSLRTMIVSLTMMIGRSGAIMGNILFPTFMSLGCIPPFIMVSVFMFSASLLSAFLPSTKKVALK